MRTDRFLVTGVFALSLATVAAAQSRTIPGFGFGFGASENDDVTSRVICNAGLQKELGVTDAQKEKLMAAVEKRDAMQKEFRGGRLTGEQITELNAKALRVAEELRKMIDEALTAEQRKRLRQ